MPPAGSTRGSLLAPVAGLALATAGLVAFLADTGALGRPSWVWADAGLSALAGLAFFTLADRHAGPVYAGTCSRFAKDFGLPVWLIRTVVVVLAPILGFGVAAYAVASLAYTLREPTARGPAIDWRASVAVGFLGLAWIVAVRAAGVRIGSDAELYSASLIASGLPLFWSARARPEAPDDGLRTFLGLVLAVGGAALVLSSTGLFHQAERTIAGTAVALAVLAFVVGPRWLRTQRLLFAERARRERAQERADLADHLHDSVLQTLALIQRRSDDPAEVAALARRQERDLRHWLLGDQDAADLESSLGGALRFAAAEIEDAERVPLELVIVGDTPLDEPLAALVAAAREAMSNAVRHGEPPVSVFCRADPSHVTVYVHDRGAGFDLDEIPADRRGVRESILGRMDRHGGSATIRVTPGSGCEVTIRMPRP